MKDYTLGFIGGGRVTNLMLEMYPFFCLSRLYIQNSNVIG
jgi:hypothetical protein